MGCLEPQCFEVLRDTEHLHGQCLQELAGRNLLFGHGRDIFGFRITVDSDLAPLTSEDKSCGSSSFELMEPESPDSQDSRHHSQLAIIAHAYVVQSQDIVGPLRLKHILNGAAWRVWVT